jgi:hypothetical protein
MADKVTGVLNLLKGLVKQTPTSKSTDLVIPTKAELEKLPQADLEKISNQLQKATNVDRRELMRGALGTIMNTAMDVGTLGKVVKAIEPPKKVKPIKESIDLIPKFFDDFREDLRERLVDNKIDEFMAEEGIDDLDAYAAETGVEIDPVIDSYELDQPLVELWMYLKKPKKDIEYEYLDNELSDIETFMKDNNISNEEMIKKIEEQGLKPDNQELKDYGLEELIEKKDG